MSSGWGSLTLVDLWISKFGGGVLVDVRSNTVGVRHDLGLDDLDSVSSTAMSTSHFVEHLGDSSAESGVSELLVHVNNTGSGEIFEGDTIVLDCIGSSLEDLVDRDDFSVSGSNLILSLHLIPELRSSDDWVLTENSHSVKSWLWGRFSWTSSSDNPVLSNL